jgi:hypothetical protein
MFSPNPSVRSAHATQGFATISGGTYHKWTVTFSLTEGCAADAVSTVELDTIVSQTAAPLGATTLRTAQDTIAAAPSAYLSYMGATLVSGTVTVDSADDYLTGSLTAQVTIGGAPTDITGTFNAPICQ